MILSPSLLASDFGNFRNTLKSLEEGGLSWVHWDVMDGQFVPNITYGQAIIAPLRKETSLFFDVHLMIVEPEKHFEDFKKAGADMLVIHAEASRHIHRSVHAIKDLGMQAGLALNPATPLSCLDHILEDLDMVLLMSVNPGFGGQSFIEQTYAKLRALKNRIEACKSMALIQVDGGVTPKNAGALVAAGADVLVAGSAFFNGKPAKEMHETFQAAVS